MHEPLGGATRRHVRTVSILVLVALGLMLAWTHIASAPAQAHASVAASVAFLSIGYRSSHNHRYHAEVVSLPSPVVGEGHRWTIRTHALR